MTALDTALGSSGGTTGANTTIVTSADVDVDDVLAIFAVGNSTISSLTVDDNATGGDNAYTLETPPAISSGTVCVAALAYSQLARPVPTGTSVVPALNSGAQGRQGFLAVRISGLAASAADAYQSAKSSTNQASATVNSGVLSDPNQIAFLAVASPATATHTKPTDWDLVGSYATSVGTNDRRLSIYSKIVTDTAALAPSVGLSTNTSWSAVIATFKTDTSTPPPSGPSIRGVIIGGVEVPAAIRGVFSGGVEVPATIKTVV